MWYKENWEESKKRFTLLWEKEIFDRPCVAACCPLDEKNPYRNCPPEGQDALHEYYHDPEWILKRNVERFEKTYFGGDSFPYIAPSWGTAGQAKYLSNKVTYHPNTIWIEPAFEDYDEFSFEFDKDTNPTFQTELNIIKCLAEAGMGKFFVTQPDNVGSYDALSALRGGEDFLMDLLVEEPEKIKKYANKMVDILIESGKDIFTATMANNDGGSAHGYFNTWAPGTHIQLQCDLSVMISPEMFQEFIVEELERSTSWVDYAIYHLDGIEQTRHLDMILAVKGINMIQWVQVDGQPDLLHNLQYIHKIQKAGKGMVLPVYKHQLNTLVNEISPYGVFFQVMDAANPKESDEIVNFIAKHSFRKNLF